jgi:hypothetical protein
VKSGYILFPSLHTSSCGGLTTLSSLGLRKNAKDFLCSCLLTIARCKQLLYFPLDNAYTASKIERKKKKKDEKGSLGTHSHEAYQLPENGTLPSLTVNQKV